MSKEDLLKIIEDGEKELETKYGNNLDENGTRKKRLIEALRRTADIPYKYSNYLDETIKQRLNGIEGAGSWYEDMTEEELLKELVSAENILSEYTPEGAWSGCSYFKIGIPGKNGIREIDDLPEGSPLFLSIVHKGTRKFSVATSSKVSPIDEKETTIILGNEEGIGEVMFTLHPGDEVAPSTLTIEGLLQQYPQFASVLEGKGNQEVILQITKEQAKSLGFDLAKLTSDGMAKKLEEEKIDVRDIGANEVTFAQIRNREDPSIQK